MYHWQPIHDGALFLSSLTYSCFWTDYSDHWMGEHEQQVLWPPW